MIELVSSSLPSWGYILRGIGPPWRDQNSGFLLIAHTSINHLLQLEAQKDYSFSVPVRVVRGHFSGQKARMLVNPLNLNNI